MDGPRIAVVQGRLRAKCQLAEIKGVPAGSAGPRALRTARAAVNAAIKGSPPGRTRASTQRTIMPNCLDFTSQIKKQILNQP
jgi:hypothetical protein